MPIYTIYEIKPLDKELEYSYIGSTKNFTRRKSTHKTVCNSLKTDKKVRTLYKFMVENGGWDAFVMVPIEEFECDTKTQARIQEQLWIDKNEKKLNMIKAYISNEELKINTKERKKNYRFINKDYITEQKKQYYLDNREEKLQYYNDNKEKIKIRRKQYYLDNKEKFIRKPKIVCENNQSSLSNPEIS
jgi:hypothetical protein